MEETTKLLLLFRVSILFDTLYAERGRKNETLRLTKTFVASMDRLDCCWENVLEGTAENGKLLKLKSVPKKKDGKINEWRLFNYFPQDHMILCFSRCGYM